MILKAGGLMTPGFICMIYISSDKPLLHNTYLLG